MTSCLSHSEAETAAIARDLARRLHAGDVLLIQGELGAGKTAFVRGLAGGLGVDEDDVSSPTFTLVQEYRGGRLPLYHADLYRLARAAEIDDLGLGDADMGDGVLAIEWPERLARPVPGATLVAIVISGDTERLIRIEPRPPGR